MSDTSDPADANHPGDRRNAGGGVAGLLVPVLWAGLAAFELARAHLAHSLVARPDRLFGGDGATGWPVASALVVVGGALLLSVARGVAVRSRHRRLSAAALALFGLGVIARIAMVAFPPDPSMYEGSPVRGAAALAVVAVMPLALIVMGIAIGRGGAALAWLGAAIGVVALWLAMSWSFWAARVGATQPQLWAVEPVEGLVAAWSAAAGVWLLGLPRGAASALRSVEDRVRSAACARMPAPGRKASLGLAVICVAGMVSLSAGYVDAVRPALTAQLAGRARAETITIAGIDRTYRVYRPANVQPAPGLVFVLHGVFGSGFQAETNLSFDAQADRLGWIAVYPDGVLDGWDAFGSTDAWGRHPGADDVAFISALIDRLEAGDRVDPDRVYVTGHSRGGMMTYRLGCALSARVAAIAPVSGNMATAGGSADVPCNLSRPVSVLAIHGTGDGVIPIGGGTVDIPFSPMADVIARWRTWDGCAGPPAVAAQGGTTVTSWRCKSGSTVATRIIDAGCHCWYADTSREIADFFVAHPRLLR